MAFENLADKLNATFKKLRGKGRLSEADIKEAMREVRLALLEADVNFKVVKDFVKTVSGRASGADVLESLTPAQMVIKIVNEELTALMGSENSKIHMGSKPPTVVMMVGLQGAGKTTNCAKLAGIMRSQNGKRPLLVACDIYRPAAITQLQVVGEKAGVPVFEMGTANPVEIAKKAVAHARDYGNDYVILDTAGRLHINEELMDELRAVKAAVSPAEIMLVVDAMTGQDAVNAAGAFHEALGIDGVMLTKLDGDTRGGAALSVRAVTGRPVKFAGIGEKLDDLEVFHPDRMASRILGMGDVLSLIEKAEQQFSEKEAAELEKKFLQNSFDMNDMLDQFRQLKKMGDLKGILGMIPGVGRQIKDADIDMKQMDRMEAIILSMTAKERSKPDLINPPRKRRIAAGSGMRVEDVNKLIKQYDQMKQMMKQMRGGKGKKKGRMNMDVMRGMGLQ